MVRREKGHKIEKKNENCLSNATLCITNVPYRRRF
jgi:hypothetical protein